MGSPRLRYPAGATATGTRGAAPARGKPKTWATSPGVVHPPAKHRQYAPPLPLPPSPTLPYPTTCPSARTHTQTLPQHPPRAAPLSQNLWFPALKCVGANDVAGGDHHKDRAPRPGALELGRARARSRTRARVFARRRRTRILQGEAPPVKVGLGYFCSLRRLALAC